MAVAHEGGVMGDWREGVKDVSRDQQTGNQYAINNTLIIASIVF